MSLKALTFVAARQLTISDIDVLSEGTRMDGHQVIPLGRDRSIIDKLQDGLQWTPNGLSQFVDLQVAAVEGQESTYPAQTIEVSFQGGERKEVKLTKQRHGGIKLWKDPVKASPPPEGEAYIFLIRDGDDVVHARYLRNLDDVPDQLRHRLAAGNSATKQHEFTGGLVLEDPLLARILEAVRTRHNVILYGPPGTGKTHLMLQTQKAFRDGIQNIVFDPSDLAKPFKLSSIAVQPITSKTHKKTEFVTFHASAAYETFVIGLRPELVGNNLNYKVVPGPFLELAEQAAQQDTAGLLLVDEINRGSTAEIFGELITVIELDKRLDASGTAVPDRTVQVRLPYVPDGTWTTLQADRFSMPWHFYMIGSMNSVDRTVAPLDSAFRRRFQIIEIPPDLSRLQIEAEKSAERLQGADRDDFVELARLVHNVLAALNEIIAIKRGPDFRLGHSYFWPVISGSGTLLDRRAAAMRAFGDSVLPQVAELLRDRPQELATALGGDANEDLLFRYHRESATGVFEDRGWVEILPFPGSLNEEEAMDVMEAIAVMAGELSWVGDTTDASASATGAPSSGGTAAPTAQGDSGVSTPGDAAGGGQPVVPSQ